MVCWTKNVLMTAMCARCVVDMLDMMMMALMMCRQCACVCALSHEHVDIVRKQGHYTFPPGVEKVTVYP